VTTESSTILRAKRLTFGFAPGKTFLGPLDLEISAAKVHALVGPNGAGKSTLLRLLVGLSRPTGGYVELDGQPLLDIPAGKRARRIAFLPQNPVAPGAASVEEVVRLGRHPYREFGMFESPADIDIVRRSMRLTQTLEFADRRMETLSGGEAQRVHLAAALAQQPDLLALDEPTSDLDIRHQLGIFRLLRDLTRDAGVTVVVVVHDLNLAAHHCDRAILLCQGKSAAQGPPGQVLIPTCLEPVYGVRFDSIDPGDGRPPWLIARDPVRTMSLSDWSAD
jgi:iron complex transport system ATP-binding protein